MNNGLMLANSGSLALVSGNYSGGTYQAINNSTLFVEKTTTGTVTLSNASLTTSGGGLIVIGTASGNTPVSLLGTINNSGSVSVLQAQLSGTLTNSGAMVLNGGTLALNGPTSRIINLGSITGPGAVTGAIANSGTITGAQSAFVGALALGSGTSAANPFINTGVLRSDAGSISLTGYVDNTGGLIESQDLPIVSNHLGQGGITISNATVTGGNLAMPNGNIVLTNSIVTNTAISVSLFGSLTLSSGTINITSPINMYGELLATASSFMAIPTIYFNSTSPNSQNISTVTDASAGTFAGNIVVGQNASLVSDQVLASVTVSANARWTIRPFGPNSPASLFALGAIAGNLNNWTSTVDINDNKLLQTTPAGPGRSLMIAEFDNQLLSGYHGGDWLGTGITSSTVAADNSATGSHLTTLSLFDNANLNFTSFGGLNVDTNSIFITTALIGDTNLDGQVNAAVLNTIAANFGTAQFTASSGDLNFDGIVNNADLTLIQNHWQSTQPYELAVIGIASLAASLGTVTITTNYNYTGSTTIAAGTLQIGDGGTTGSAGTGAIINNSVLAFDRSDTVVIPNLISGTGSISQLTGTVILIADNTFTGGADIAPGATLQIGNGGTTGGFGSGAVMDNGLLAFNRSDALVIPNLISGIGSVSLLTGTVILTADNTFAGSVNIAPGAVLQLGNGGTTGNFGTGTVIDDGALLFNQSDTLIVPNLISGTGSVSQLSGTVILTANNSFAGGMNIASGAILQIGNGGTTGSFGSGAVVDDGTLVFNRSDALVIPNPISGSGSISQLTGTVIFAADNSFTGGMDIAPGATLQIGNGGTTGNFGTGAVINNGDLVFHRSDTLVVPNLISGAGSVSLLTGTLVLTANNTFAGGLNIIAGATAQIGNGGTTGTFGTGAIVNDGTLVFNRSDTVVIPNLITGAGTLSQLAGTTIFTADNLFTGGATIASGATLQAGNGGTTGSFGSGPVVNSGTLAFNRSDTIVIPNVISGSGSVSQLAGTVVLTGANTWTGGTTIAPSATLQIGNNGTTGSLGTGSILNNGMLAINRSDTITFSNAISGTGSISALAGTSIITGTNTFSGGVNIASGATVQIGNGAGVGDIGTAGVSNNSALVINRTGNLIIAGPISGAGTLTNNNSGTVTFAGAYSATGPVNIASGEVVFGKTSAPRQDTGVVVKMQSLTMGSTQVLDMTNHDLIIGNTSYAAVQSQIQAAFGAVSGPAITTSTSNVLGTGTDNTLPIPIDPAAFGLTSWDNVSITEPNSIIVKYTLFGDSTLDGTVNGDDFSVIAGNFGKTSPGISNILASWLMGDVTLDGIVNGDDFSVVAGNFGKGPLGTLDTVDAPAVVSGGGGSSNVPEPTSLALLGIGAAGLLLRRKKR